MEKRILGLLHREPKTTLYPSNLTDTDVFAAFIENRGSPLELFKNPRIKPTIQQQSLRYVFSEAQIDIWTAKWEQILNPQQAVWAAQIVGEKIKNYEKEPLESTNDKLDKLNTVIIRLLKIKNLPEEQAALLFSHFSINNKDLQWYPHDHIYEPLVNLYSSYKINERWKRTAAEQIWARIKQEQKGELTPIHNFSAAEGYNEVLDKIVCMDEVPVSPGFFEAQTTLMLNKTDQPVVDFWSTGKAMNLLYNKELKHRFVRRQISIQRQAKKQCVFDPDTERTAKQIIKEFPEDKELTAFLQAELAGHRQFLKRDPERVNQQERERVKREQRKKELLERMKETTS